MKLLPLSIAFLAAGIVSLVTPRSHAVTEATTPPVGFLTVTVFGHDNTTGLDGNTAVSVPMYNTADFQGAVASLDSATQFTLTGATWTAGAYAMPADGGTATTPRLARIKSGAQVGKFFRVTANTSNQLTVDLSLYGIANINTALAAGDLIELLPANTIGSVFGTTPPILAGNTTATTADNILLQNGAGWFTYYWKTNVTPNRWVLNGGGNTDRATAIIYPDTAAYVLKRSVGDISLVVSGAVPTTAEQSDVEAPNTFLANRFPTDTTLGALGLESLPGWVKNTTAASSDNVYILSPSGSWARYYFKTNATPTAHWVLNGGGNTDRGPITQIPAGTAVYISFGNSTPATLSQTLPYNPFAP
ncbi:MAG: hypothetical protein WCF18_16995 [Chthoniobacteraceae bacterium]